MDTKSKSPGNQIYKDICKAVGVFCVQWDSAETSTKARTFFPQTSRDSSNLSTVKNGMWGDREIWGRGDQIVIQGKKEWGKTCHMTQAVDAKEIKGRGDTGEWINFGNPWSWDQVHNDRVKGLGHKWIRQ